MTKKSITTVTLRIELLNVEPLVWRRVRLPARTTLKALHTVIQTVMGWEDSHMHEFRVEDVRIGMVDLDDPEEMTTPPQDEKDWTLQDVLATAVQQFEYEYDFGDGWRHRLVIEPNRAADNGVAPLCLAGENACPPEDVGGPPGYEDFLMGLNDPRHPEHKTYLTWIGGVWDPKGFDLNRINRLLRKMAGKRS